MPRPAATVALLRDGASGLETLLVRRPPSMSFAPDAHVFPGGAVDPTDADVEDSADPRAVAAVRELFEEAGILLADPAVPAAAADPASSRPAGPAPELCDRARRKLLAGEWTMRQVVEELGVVLRADRLVPLSHWVTPRTYGRRFDAWFFAAEAPSRAEATLIGTEVSALRWLTPRTALDAMAAGDLVLWAPTSTTLQQIEHVRSFPEIRARLAVGEDRPIASEQVSPAVVRIAASAAGAVPGQSGNVYLVGEREVVVVDPGDPSETVADALLAAVAERGAAIGAIALTHVDPDHAAGAAGLAERLSVPVVCGQGGSRRLPFTVRELGDGESVPGTDIRLVAVATPGHRPDHLAFIGAGEGIVVSGDLVGEQASRSITGPPDVAAWIRSLERLDALAPRLLLPGHGEPIHHPRAAIVAERERLQRV